MCLQPTIPLTLSQDKCYSEEDALREIHAKVWPGDNASLKEIKERLEYTFFNSRFYDLTKLVVFVLIENLDFLFLMMLQRLHQKIFLQPLSTW